MKEPVIRFRDFSWQYAAQTEPTLKELNLEIFPGEKLLICGPSGCGKSTIAHCLNGLIPFSYHGEASGSLTLYGTETRELSIAQISKQVGTVLQDSDGQFVGLTVAEDIAFALENDNVPQAELFRRVKATAEEVRISSLLDCVPNQLSGGQKQRVSLAGVLVDNVPVLLFDEPLANLDPASGKHSIELIDEIHQKTGAAVIIIEHRIEDVLHRPVDRVVLMNEGRILSVSTPDELLSSGLLAANGIREPLCVTALRYAGIRITPELAPSAIGQPKLSEAERKQVREFYRQAPSAPVPEPGEALLEVSGITQSYPGGFTALREISLTLRKGEMLSIVGKNGAGKSTFAKMICGFLTPEKGSVTLAGAELSGLTIRERAEHIGYVMQNPNQMLSQPMIRDEVALGLRKRGRDEAFIREKTDAVLRICGLYPFRNWPVSALSYGQKKRVTIAAILALDPEILILDEPTAGQDYRHYTEIMEFLRQLNRSGVTVVMITHDMHLMLEYCSRALVFCDGRLLRDDTPARILTDPEIVERANLRITSLYELAGLCGIPEKDRFTERFIGLERAERDRMEKERGKIEPGQNEKRRIESSQGEESRMENSRMENSRTENSRTESSRGEGNRKEGA